MRMSQRVGVVVLGSALALAGCGGGGGGSDAGTTTTKVVAKTTTTAKATTTTPPTTTTTPNTVPPTQATTTVNTVPPTTPPDTTPPTSPPTTAQPQLAYGSPCTLGSHPDCIDPDEDGQGTYLKGGARCMAESAPVLGKSICTDLDGDGAAGYPDGG